MNEFNPSHQRLPFSRWMRNPMILYLGILLLGSTCLFFFYLGPTWIPFRYTTWDGLRDVLAARHLLAGGGWLADPTLHGYSCWYPPTHAAFHALVSYLFDADLLRVYALSAIAFNWISIPLFFLLCYWVCEKNPHAAFLATLSLAALPWMVTYVLASPTVLAHATVLSLLLVALYVFGIDCMTWKGWIGLSIAFGMMGLFHPPTFLILFGTVLVHAYMRLRFDSFSPQIGLQVLLFLLISLGVSSPYWISYSLGPIRNPDPIRYIAPALYSLEFVLPGKSLLRSIPFLLIALVGGWYLIKHRRKPVLGFIFALTLVSMIGQIPVYGLALIQKTIPEYYDAIYLKTPVLVPHEFQLYFQLMLCVMVAVGIHALFSWAKRRAGKLPFAVIPVILLGISLIPSWKEFPAHSKLFLWPYRQHREWNGVVRYIHENTGVTDVICSPTDATSFFVIGVRTGRKSLYTYPSHANPRADMEKRHQVHDGIYYTFTKNEIMQAAEEYAIRFLLCSRKQVDPARIRQFQDWFPTVYQDDMVLLLEIK